MSSPRDGGTVAVSAVLGDGLVSVDELDERAKEPPVQDFLAKDSLDPQFELTLGNGREVRAAQLTRAYEANSPRVPFEGIGIGKPLTIPLEQVYLGNYPDTMRWVPGAEFTIGLARGCRNMRSERAIRGA
jgi:hypothetical protein